MNKIATFLVLCFLLSGCTNSASAEKAFESKLDKAYEDLYSARFGLEYPPSKKDLDICKNKKIESCLRVYTAVQDAKKFIHEVIERDESLALSDTLNKITVKCGVENSMKDLTCVGAVISLYFFDKEKYQQQIRDALTSSGNSVIKLVFSYRYEWMYNRPDSDRWIAFVNSLPEPVMSHNEKEPFIEYFEESNKSFKKFGVML
jgi:hypothetical protein